MFLYQSMVEPDLSDTTTFSIKCGEGRASLRAGLNDKKKSAENVSLSL